MGNLKNVKSYYCTYCGNKLKSFTKTTDWGSRKLHKKCYLNIGQAAMRLLHLKGAVNEENLQKSFIRYDYKTGSLKNEN